MKYEIAEELGLLDRVMEQGWKSLSSKETGRIGGLMTKETKSTKKKFKSNKIITNINKCEQLPRKLEKTCPIAIIEKLAKELAGEMMDSKMNVFDIEINKCPAKEAMKAAISYLGNYACQCDRDGDGRRAGCESTKRRS